MTEIPTVTDGQIHARVKAPLAGWLLSRAARAGNGLSISQQATTELALWHAALAAELSRLRLTRDQLACVADVIASPLIEPAIAGPVGRVFAQCYDAFRIARSGPGGDVSSYGAKHGIDEAALLDYLGALGPAADHALADAISRHWEQGLDATAEGFAQVGLRAAA